jgi:group I intron endonuclease
MKQNIIPNQFGIKKKARRISIPGIYKIECTETNSVYIGQSQSIDNRIKVHLQALRAGKHFSAKLQEDFKKYGENKFIMEAVFESDDQNLLKWETHYIEEFKANGYEIYNNLHVTDDVSMIQCKKEYRGLLQKISNMLNDGKIKRGELEEALFYKENQW